jgi:hypothetical protein
VTKPEKLSAKTINALSVANHKQRTKLRKQLPVLEKDKIQPRTSEWKGCWN